MNAVISDKDDPRVAEFRSPGPGERLRAARLAQEMDLGKVANALHLTRPVVEALERDEYENVGARVFVRGYLRNYARLVDLPVDGILRQFESIWPEEQSELSRRQDPKIPAGGISTGSSWVKAMTWVIVIGIVVLFLVWWRGYLDAWQPATESQPAGEADATALETPALLDVEPAPIAAPDGQLPLPQANESTQSLIQAEAAVAEEAPAATEAAAAAPEVAASDETLAVDSVVGETTAVAAESAPVTVNPEATEAVAETTVADAPPATANVAAVAEPVVAEASTVLAAVTTGSSPQALVAESQSGSGAPVAAAGIVFEFSDSCWVDIRDNSREFKLFGEMASGSREVLGGKPPYKVVLGNARAVKVSIDGKPFDVSRYARGNVARFTLNP